MCVWRSSLNIQGNNNVNFGWSCETHKKIMSTAIKDLPEFQKYKDTLEDYVQRPDHDDIGFLANKHFYFGKKVNTDTFEGKKSDMDKSDIIINELIDSAPKKNTVLKAFSKIFNTDAVSFMDYSGRNNAKAAFEDQIEIMDNAIEDEDDDFAIQNAARACHFLQDVAQPQHVEDNNVVGKAIDLKIHTDYEDYAEKNADTFASNCITKDRMPRKAPNLFLDTFATTKGGTKITRENEPNWSEITQKQFNLAVQATKEFLQNVSAQMGLKNRGENSPEKA